ncbi:DUF2802 domain-containing protein [Neptunicella marina]|uniref:DUF2802 domain-containing protein n=1 Tax=Neptunicella marina TaxID=2125989 RepID=A0A8J6IR94_9ALTE|nr:DUF2802 domain-containing protein [Neptunicella marina]MBC3764974.1 DUF2802 domain-containing protein [Neptunicella marina]
MMQWYVICAVTLILVLLFLWLWQQQKQLAEHLRQKIQTQDKNLLDLKAELQLQHEAIHELRTGSLGVGQKVQTLVRQLQETQAKQDEMEEHDPDSKLYGHAAKLAQQGASIEEIVEECELTRGEAELLIQLHRQSN